VDLRGKLPFKRAHRCLCSSTATGLNQVGNRLRLRQINLAIQKRSFRKLTCPRQPGAKFAHAFEQHIEKDRSTVTLYFDYIFAAE